MDITNVYKQYPKELLLDLNASVIEIPENNIVLNQGDLNQYIYCVFSGSLHAVHYGSSGNISLFSKLHKGDYFGNAIAFANMISPVTVVSDAPCILIKFLYDNLLYSNDQIAKQFLADILKSLSMQFFFLQKRVSYLTSLTLEDKITAFLYDAQLNAQSNEFDIPFNREELAVFLNCDRSALSRGLSKLKSAGKIDYKKNHFVIYFK